MHLQTWVISKGRRQVNNAIVSKKNLEGNILSIYRQYIDSVGAMFRQ